MHLIFKFLQLNFPSVDLLRFSGDVISDRQAIIIIVFSSVHFLFFDNFSHSTRIASTIEVHENDDSIDE